MSVTYHIREADKSSYYILVKDSDSDAELKTHMYHSKEAAFEALGRLKEVITNSEHSYASDEEDFIANVKKDFARTLDRLAD